ncbi:MAG: hypothetical protein JO256_11605, partial [Alphaproteobacteria bacterium]|nr:hypothetical protein [Alphaproteobacteria bacterium]
RMVDKISMMQALNQSHTRSAVRDHGGEVYHFLRAWLGHESHVSGAVTQEAAGLVVTIRIDGRNVASYAGSEGELDALVLKAAQHVVDVAQNHKPVPV